MENLLGKKVVGVRTLNQAGKLKRQRRADAGRTAHWKKAIVRLKEGENLDLV
ncbi:MAG: 50S ribosomal protein L23 [Haloferula sp.]